MGKPPCRLTFASRRIYDLCSYPAHAPKLKMVALPSLLRCPQTELNSTQLAVHERGEAARASLLISLGAGVKSRPLLDNLFKSVSY